MSEKGGEGAFGYHIWESQHVPVASSANDDSSDLAQEQKWTHHPPSLFRMKGWWPPSHAMAY